MKKLTKIKVAFLDRDGVINKKADEHCYITRLEDFVINDDIIDDCLDLKKQGFEFIVITNQRGIARGLLSTSTLKDIHALMREEFKKNSIDILDVFYCPHNIDSCDCRKPKDGLLRQACLKYDIDLPNSILISDSVEDLQMGKKFGIGNNIFYGL